MIIQTYPHERNLKALSKISREEKKIFQVKTTDFRHLDKVKLLIY